MGITTRYTQSTEEADEIIRELVAAQGEQGEEGAAGAQGEAGEDGESAPAELPIKYITASSGTVILNAAVSRRFRITVNGDITLKFSGFIDGMKFSLSLLQGSGGGNLVTWPANIKWANGDTEPTLTTTDEKRDTFGFERFKNGVEDSYDGFVIGQNI